MASHNIVDAGADVSSAHEDLALGIKPAALVHSIHVDESKPTTLSLDTAAQPKGYAIDSWGSYPAEAIHP